MITPVIEGIQTSTGDVVDIQIVDEHVQLYDPATGDFIKEVTVGDLVVMLEKV